MPKNKKRSFFKFFRKGTKFTRDHFSVDPLEDIKETGLAGKIIGKGGDEIIEPAIQKNKLLSNRIDL